MPIMPLRCRQYAYATTSSIIYATFRHAIATLPVFATLGSAIYAIIAAMPCFSPPYYTAKMFAMR